MEITIHRGTHQIGGTCIEINSKQARLIFDIGAELPDVENPNKPKNDLIVPGLFKSLPYSDKAIDAVFVSHNHGDHIGLLNEARPEIPIYIGEYAKEIHNVIADFIPDGIKIKSETTLKNNKAIVIKDITITPYLVDHSAFDAYAFLIECDGKRIIYTGDFRRHGVKGSLIVKLSQNPLLRNADVLLMEGTNLYKDDFVAETESDLQLRAEYFMNNTTGNVFILQSSSNIDRIAQMFKAARHTNRLFLIDIFTAHIVSKLPDSFPKPSTCKGMKIFFPFWLTKKMFKDHKDKLMNEFARYKIDKKEMKTRTDLCIMVRENMLFDISNRMNTTNSGLIYSKWEEYKKEPKTSKFVSYFESQGLATNSIHTSGHADIPTVQNFVNNINPQKILPIHTITPDKFVELFGSKVVLANDNQTITI